MPPARSLCPGHSSLDTDCAPAEYGSYQEARTGKISQIEVSTLLGEPRPVGEQAWLVLVDLLQPGHRFGVLAAESLELVHGPPDEVLVDAPCQEAQLGAEEGSVIVDPALDLG